MASKADQNKWLTIRLLLAAFVQAADVNAKQK
jgi:hypothetical protein